MSLTDKRPEMTRKHIVKKFQEETLASIQLAKPLLENNLLKFNKFVLEVEEGKGKCKLADVHTQMCSFIDGNKKKFKLLMIPRGHLKSTIVTVGRTLQAILADRNKRVLIANATYNNACSFLTDVKRHLKFNEKIKMFWGDPLEDVEVWARDKITLKKPVGASKEPSVTAMGLESNLTSQHYDMIIMDDLVNGDYVNTSDQIEKTINFYKECLNLLEPGGELIMIGTRWHDRDLYGWVMDTDNNVISNFEIFLRKAFEGSLDTDDGFQALFPEKFTRKILLKLYEQQGPYFFSTQYLNDPIPEENATFKKVWFQYYEPADLKGATINQFVMVDPAISLEKDADYTAIVTISIDMFQNIYIRDIIRKRMSPDDLISHLFKLNEQYHPQEIAVEDVAYQKALQYYITQEMNKRNIYLPIVQVKPANRSKDQRIKGLQPLYSNGKIFHSKIVANIQQLEDELLRFPRGKHDDVIDSLSYSLDIMYAPKRKVTRRNKQKYLYS